MEILTTIVFGIWLSVLTAVVVYVLIFFRRLGKGVTEGNLEDVLNKLLDRQDNNKKDITLIKDSIKGLELQGKLHVQRVGLVRFNPFSEIGGEHSFSLAMLDALDSGVVITVLHTRENTRIYAKDVRLGKSTLELSKDEKKAIDSATKV